MHNLKKYSRLQNEIEQLKIKVEDQDQIIQELKDKNMVIQAN